jgi:NADH-quinone oxidoreductase subunit K
MGLGAYIAVSAALFGLGIVTIISRRNVIYILMGIEMILNAANINFVAFNRFGLTEAGSLEGKMFAIFTIILAAAEAAVALAIVLNVFYLFDSIKPSEADLLRE